MRLALLEEKVDFVDLLLTSGFVMSSFLTVVELRNLYNLTKPKAHIRELLGHGNDDKPLKLNDVHKLLKQVVNSHSHRYYRDTNNLFDFCSTINKITFEDPYLELLIWAILTRRNNLAKYLWKTCNFPLNTAIVATCIYQGIRDKVTDSAVRAECKAMKDHFETIAIKLTDLSYDKNVTNSVSLIHQRHMRWGGLSTLDLALVARDMSFVSSPCARAGQGMRWEGIRVKFYVRISYRVLLMISHFVLVLFNLGFIPTYTEGILALVIASEAFEKGLEMLSNEPFSASYSSWNSYDVVLLIVFLLGFFLRSLSFLTELGNILYAGCAVLFCLRLLRFLYVFPRLGSKILIFVYMVPKLVEFLLFLLLMVLGYGIASKVLVSDTCKNREKMTWTMRTLMDLFIEVFLDPYWQMFGNINPHMFANTNLTTCDDQRRQWRWLSSCAPCGDGVEATVHTTSLYSVFGQLMLAVYLLMSNLLLLNLIIAIFTTVYERVREQSIEHWNYEMYRLAREYQYKPALPPPLAVFVYLWRSVGAFARRRKSEQDEAASACEESDVWLNQFERQQLRSFKMMEEEEESLEATLCSLKKTIDTLASTISTKFGQDGRTSPPPPPPPPRLPSPPPRPSPRRPPSPTCATTPAAHASSSPTSRRRETRCGPRPTEHFRIWFPPLSIRA
ncbi:transient receptor potential cation channel trpm-like [Penaeus vannamei]|uniref:transient receptor potential cation channel trpm-like n=1 Tax=Penaeus vannamei TaxID=6689 RepID=UPI00387F4C7F